MEYGPVFIAFGALFLTGLAADALGHRTRLPAVTLLLIMGILAGQSGFDLIPDLAIGWYEPLSMVALTMVAFLLGSALRYDKVAAHGRAILGVSAAVVIFTMLLLAMGLWLMALPLGLSLVIGAIATATDPAATEDTLRQYGADGAFADVVRGIVAIDDAWGMIVFALAMVVAQAMGNGGFDLGHMGLAVYEVGGALALGLVVGLPGAYLTGRLKQGEPTRLEALGLVFLTLGLALTFEVSFLLAGMMAGAVIANLARHHERAFHEIEMVERPFLILFFLLAGASMEIAALAAIGWLGLAYIVLRIAGRIAGGWLGGVWSGMPPVDRRWIGPALLPQAGVAVGMALVAAAEMPQHAELLLSLTIGTTVVFEVIGPFVTMLAVRRVQDAA
ncbi:cation:proton antiporter [Maliponia aquimaris]|uniref:Sodium/hydrogen exchanger family protein n=1 Tax=Maliponia aquimaris TaxID=1673631 RepID=A0A238KCL3_9RHOB|nr:cation:proton antiporter [Maliponia aquimaris]SMX40267.1 Sodium/hydrogen exchanger family protein [Maliponia aquimaris]